MDVPFVDPALNRITAEKKNIIPLYVVRIIIIKYTYLRVVIAAFKMVHIGYDYC